jgi:hypothetical protein
MDPCDRHRDDGLWVGRGACELIAPTCTTIVIAALEAAIQLVVFRLHHLAKLSVQKLDGRIKSGHDAVCLVSPHCPNPFPLPKLRQNGGRTMLKQVTATMAATAATVAIAALLILPANAQDGGDTTPQPIDLMTFAQGVLPVAITTSADFRTPWNTPLQPSMATPAPM